MKLTSLDVLDNTAQFSSYEVWSVYVYIFFLISHWTKTHAWSCVSNPECPLNLEPLSALLNCNQARSLSLPHHMKSSIQAVCSLGEIQVPWSCLCWRLNAHTKAAIEGPRLSVLQKTLAPVDYGICKWVFYHTMRLIWFPNRVWRRWSWIWHQGQLVSWLILFSFLFKLPDFVSALIRT